MQMSSQRAARHRGKWIQEINPLEAPQEDLEFHIRNNFVLDAPWKNILNLRHIPGAEHGEEGGQGAPQPGENIPTADTSGELCTVLQLLIQGWGLAGAQDDPQPC